MHRSATTAYITKLYRRLMAAAVHPQHAKQAYGQYVGAEFRGNISLCGVCGEKKVESNSVKVQYSIRIGTLLLTSWAEVTGAVMSQENSRYRYSSRIKRIKD